MGGRNIGPLLCLLSALAAGVVWMAGCGGGGGTSFTGTVLDDETEEAVPDARAVVGAVLTQTDASGQFKAANPTRNTDGKITVSLSKVGYRTFDRDFDASSSPQIRLIPRDLADHGRVTGRVLDTTTQQGIGLAELEVQPIFGGEVTPTDEIQFTHTASDGSFEVTGFIGGTGRIIARVSGYLTEEVAISIEVGDPPPPEKPYTIVMTPTTERVDVQGVVTDLETGAPLSGLSVNLGGVSATTQADGSFTVIGVPVGPRTVSVNAEGYDPYSASVTIEADMSLLRIALSRSLPPPGSPANVRGVVTLQGQESNAGATVVALSDGDQEVDRATTNDAGEYGLLLPPGPYTLRASASGFTPQEQVVTVPGTGQVLTGVDFALAP